MLLQIRGRTDDFKVGGNNRVATATDRLRWPLRLTQLRDDLADAALNICDRRFARVSFPPNPHSTIIIGASARFRATRGWDVLVIIAYGADDCARPEQLRSQNTPRMRDRRINR